MATTGVNKYKVINANKTLNATSVYKSNVKDVTADPWGYLQSAVPAYNYAVGATSIGAGGYLLRIGAYLAAILIVITIIVLFIHFFITPIFRFQPGAPGIITVPGFDDGKLFWNKTNASLIENSTLPIHGSFLNYSLNIDIFIQNPMQFSTKHRILFSRGASERINPITGDTITGIFKNYNLVIALAPNTTDIIVSILNSSKTTENIIIYNVPVQEPFRLGIVVMEKAFEVYMNGKLNNTRLFNAAPMDVKGDILPAVGVELNIAKLQNLKIWNRVLTTSEIINATPALASAADFGATDMASSSSCLNSVVDIVEKVIKVDKPT